MSSDEKCSHSPDSIHSPGTSDSLKKNLRPRTNFTPQQLCYLEEQFQVTEFPKLPKRKEIADHLNLTVHHVQVWFQNRRAKNKRKRKQHASVEHMKHTPKPPPFWPQNLPFTSNFTEMLNKKAEKGKKSNSKPSPVTLSPLQQSPSRPASTSLSSQLNKQPPAAVASAGASVTGLTSESETPSEDSGQASAATSFESDSASSCSGSVFCRSSSASSVASQSQNVQSLVVSYKLSQFAMPARNISAVSESYRTANGSESDRTAVHNGMLEKVNSEIRKYEANNASFISHLMSQSVGEDFDYTNVSLPNHLPKAVCSFNQEQSSLSTDGEQLIESDPALVSPSITSAASSVNAHSIAHESATNGMPREGLESISTTTRWLMSKQRLKGDAHSTAASQASSSSALVTLLSANGPTARLSSSAPVLPTYEHAVEFQEQNLQGYSHSSKSDSYLPSPSFGTKEEMQHPLSTPLSASDAGMEDIFSLDLFNSANDPNFGFQSPIFAEDPIALSDIHGEEQWHTIHCAAHSMPNNRVQSSIVPPLNQTSDYFPDIMLHTGYHSQKQNGQDFPLIAAQASCIDAIVPPVTAPPPYQAPLSCDAMLPMQAPLMASPPLPLMFTTSDSHHLGSSFFSS